MSEKKQKKPVITEQNWALIKRLFAENFSDYRRRYAFALFCMGLVAIMTALSAWIVKDVMNEVLANQNSGILMTLGLSVMIIFIVKGLATYGQVVTLSRVGNALIANLQVRMFRHMMTLGMDYFDKTSSGELITRISHNASAVRDVMQLLIASIGRDLLSLIALVIVMVLQQPLLSLAFLCIGPIAALTVGRLVRKSRKVAKMQFDSMAELNRVIKESVTGIQVIKAFTLEKTVDRNMQQAVGEVEKRNNRLISLAARTSPIMESLGGLAIGAVVIYAGFESLGPSQSPGELMSFITAFLLAYEPAKRLAKLRINLENGLVGVRLMFELLDTPPKQRSGEKALAANALQGEVTFESVDFAYQDDAVLKGVSFTAQRGEKIALVGASGSGKSTIVKLLLRFYDPTGGRILIDGQDIRDLTVENLRSHIAFVGQDAQIFSGTLADNIGYGADNADMDAIIAAAKAANAHDFIAALPEGYQSEAGENGAQLSGGQKQRIAIARAILRNAPIIVLDEATSALDTGSERKIQAAMDALIAGRTTLVIAHRLSTITNADRIMVVHQGEIIETGSHADLLAGAGAYAEQYNLTLANNQEASDEA